MPSYKLMSTSFADFLTKLLQFCRRCAKYLLYFLKDQPSFLIWLGGMMQWRNMSHLRVKRKSHFLAFMRIDSVFPPFVNIFHD